MKFCCLKDSIRDTLESLYKLRIRESAHVLELADCMGFSIEWIPCVLVVLKRALLRTSSYPSVL